MSRKQKAWRSAKTYPLKSTPFQHASLLELLLAAGCDRWLAPTSGAEGASWPLRSASWRSRRHTRSGHRAKKSRLDSSWCTNPSSRLNSEWLGVARRDQWPAPAQSSTDDAPAAGAAAAEAEVGAAGSPGQLGAGPSCFEWLERRLQSLSIWAAFNLGWVGSGLVRFGFWAGGRVGGAVTVAVAIRSEFGRIQVWVLARKNWFVVSGFVALVRFGSVRV